MEQRKKVIYSYPICIAIGTVMGLVLMTVLYQLAPEEISENIWTGIVGFPIIFSVITSSVEFNARRYLRKGN